MLEAPVARTLAELTIPMIFGMLSMVLYNLADTYFVGQLGKDQLAAMSFTFPVVLTINSLSLGIGMGAAIATLIGRSSTFALSMYVLFWRERILTMSIPRPCEIWQSWREILHVGIPDAGARMIIPVGQGAITRIVAGYGAAAVAGYGVATRVEFFSLAVLSALATVIGPFVGQNLGAKQYARVRRGFTVSCNFSIAFGLSLFVGYLFLADKIAGLFNEDPEVVATAALYIRLVSLAFAAQGFYFVVNAGLNVLKRPLLAAGLSLLELFVLAIPLALIGSHLFELTGVFAAIGVSYLLTGIFGWVLITRVLAEDR